MAADRDETLRRGHPILVSGLVVAVSLGTAVLTLAAFAACDVGVNQGANILAVSGGFVGLVAVNALAVGLAGHVVRTRGAPDSWALGAQLALLVVSAYLCWRYLATPADYPSPWCRDNVPPWTPSWLPS